MTDMHKWLWEYLIEQYPEHGYHPWFGFTLYIPGAVENAIDSLLSHMELEK